MAAVSLPGRQSRRTGPVAGSIRCGPRSLVRPLGIRHRALGPARRTIPDDRAAATHYCRPGPARNRPLTSVYDAASQRIGSIDALGNRNTSVFDAAGRQTGSINPLGYRSTTVYDAASEPVSSIDPLLNRTTTVFDAAGRTIASNRSAAKPHDHALRRGQRGDGHYQCTRIPDDIRIQSDRQPLRTTDARGNITTTVYDAAARTVAGIDALGNRIDDGIDDAASRTVGSINALGNRSTTVYDMASERVAGDRSAFESDDTSVTTRQGGRLPRSIRWRTARPRCLTRPAR